MEILSENDDFSPALIGAPVELKLFDSAEEGVIEGYGATFNGVDLGGDTILPGAFTDTIREHATKGKAPPMLWHHRTGSPVGKWLGMGEDARGLRVRGKLNLETSGGRDAYHHVKAGDATGLSIGYTVPPGGAARTKSGRALSRILLHEISLTPVPMDEWSQVTSVKAVGTLTSREDLEMFLTKSGLPRRAARKVARGGWAALAHDEDDQAAVELMEALRSARSEIAQRK